MHLYLIRHGEALSAREAQVASDADRPLSEAGRDTVTAVGHGLRRLKVRPTRVAASPLRRAQETADALCRTLAPAPAVESRPELQPDEPPERFIEWLRQGGSPDDVVIVVGHQPLLGRLVDRLVPGIEAALTIMPAGVVWIGWKEPRGGVIRGWWAPEVFLGGAAPGQGGATRR